MKIILKKITFEEDIQTFIINWRTEMINIGGIQGGWFWLTEIVNMGVKRKILKILKCQKMGSRNECRMIEQYIPPWLGGDVGRVVMVDGCFIIDYKDQLMVMLELNSQSPSPAP